MLYSCMPQFVYIRGTKRVDRFDLQFLSDCGSHQVA